MSGPVGQAGLTTVERVEREPGAGEERQQQQLRAGALRPQRQPRAPRRDARRCRRAAADCPAPPPAPARGGRSAISTASCSPERRATASTLAPSSSPSSRCRWIAAADHLAARQPAQAGFAAFRQARKPAAAFAQRPFQQRIVAAADDRRRRRVRERRPARRARPPASGRARPSETASCRSPWCRERRRSPPARRACAPPSRR